MALASSLRMADEFPNSSLMPPPTLSILDPTVDIGFDIAAEYAEACRLRGQS